MAHISKKLRLMRTCLFELLSLFLDFVEQPCILDRQRRLRETRFAMIVERLRELGMPVDRSAVPAMPRWTAVFPRLQAAMATALAR